MVGCEDQPHLHQERLLLVYCAGALVLYNRLAPRLSAGTVKLFILLGLTVWRQRAEQFLKPLPTNLVSA